MIEINLLPGQKDFGALSSISSQFSVINWKFLIVVVVIHLLVRPLVIEKALGVKVSTIENDVKSVTTLLEKEQAKNQENLVIVRQAEELEEREKKLTEKLDIVKKILKQKKNPVGIMIFIAKNIPNDVWINSLKIENDKIEIIGESQSYKSIGNFIENLQSSIFFGNKVKLEGTEPKQDEATGRRFEQFTLTSNVERYN
jgi:type IV pilus assembly protein PilN